VSRVIILGDQEDGGNDDAPVRRVESDGREVVVEVPRVEGKDLEKEFESIASEGLEGHWVIGRKAARRRRDRETDRGGKMQRCGMKVKIIESMQTCTRSTVERERNLVVAVVAWSEGEGIRQESRLGVRTVWSD
jgi:hypothetical protein